MILLGKLCYPLTRIQGPGTSQPQESVTTTKKSGVDAWPKASTYEPNRDSAALAMVKKQFDVVSGTYDQRGNVHFPSIRPRHVEEHANWPRL